MDTPSVNGLSSPNGEATKALITINGALAGKTLRTKTGTNESRVASQLFSYILSGLFLILL